MNTIEREQAMTSSHLRISKGDLVDEGRVGAVRGALTALVPPATWTDVEALANDVAAAVERADAPTAEEHAAHADANADAAEAHTAEAYAHVPNPHAHTHTAQAHAQRHPFVSCQLPLPGTVDAATFEVFLRSLPESIVRAKGIVRLREPAGAKRSFQLAAGRAEISPCDLLDPDSLEPVAVFVGSGIDAPALGAALARLMAEGPPDPG
jgi:G3E family GTPase